MFNKPGFCADCPDLLIKQTHITSQGLGLVQVNRAQPDVAEAMMMKAGGESVEWGDQYSHIPQVTLHSQSASVTANPQSQRSH